jgi:subtilisin family serine protease
MTNGRYTLDSPPFAGRSGVGVVVAVVDSGIASGHPHVGIVARGVLLKPDGIETLDFGDRIGHGTAVAAAILEKAPDIELVAVRVFERELATSASVLARGITWAAEHGAKVINLSLGTPNEARREVLLAAVEHATSLGAVVVSALEVDDVPYLPGSLPGVVGVRLDWGVPRDALIVDDTNVWRASGYPRPIPGVAPKRNLNGISFAVANASGFLARLLEDRSTVRADGLLSTESGNN